jgi:hypothetical protein
VALWDEHVSVGIAYMLVLLFMVQLAAVGSDLVLKLLLLYYYDVNVSL